jgi:micrococcal nuclease
MLKPAYTYRAVVSSIYDGDTIRVSLDLGFDTWIHNQALRLSGIDAPEISGVERPQGLVSRDWLREKLPIGTAVVVKTYKDKKEKYGRYLADIYIDNTNINVEMISLGLAEKYVP